MGVASVTSLSPPCLAASHTLGLGREAVKEDIREKSAGFTPAESSSARLLTAAFN
jgi:hypothetical protein